MTRPMLVVIGVLLVAVLGLGYFSYSQVQRNGVLSTTLGIANQANKDWSESYDKLQIELEGRQSRLDEALLREQVRTQLAEKREHLFRVEIDQLKETNNELKQLLETRIPDRLLNWLCAEGYADPTVCAGLLPST